MATQSNGQNGVTWASELGRKYTSGVAHFFVLHFNVQDYARDLVTVTEYLQAMLARRDMVITYDLAQGIQFANPEQEKLLIEALGLDQQGAGGLGAALGMPGLDDQGPAEVELPREPVKALPLLEEALHLHEIRKGNGEVIYPRVAVIVQWPEMLAPASDVAMMQPADRFCVATLTRWASDPKIVANNGIVVLVTRNLMDLADPLRASTSRVEAIAVPLPDEQARLVWIEEYLDRKKSERNTEIELTAWGAVREAMAHQVDNQTGWYWDEAGAFPWVEDNLDGAPTPELRREAKKLLTKARRDAKKAIPELKLAIPVEVLARMTAGLSLVHIEDIFLRALHEGRPVDRDLVKDRKDEIIRNEFGDVLEILEPEWGLDMVAGHALVKRYFQDYVISALQKGDKARAPQGVLLVGPPGTGKTAIVEAVAFECGFNCVSLNPARILGQYVGTSERNLEKALLAVEALAPAIVFMDEIDQKLGRRSEGPSGDSGVTARLFSRLMEFMSDTRHRGQLVWLAASNRPDLLDAAFKRPGRFDAIIPMLLPETDDERLELFDVMFRKYGLNLEWDDTRRSLELKMQQAAKLTDGYTGAEIEAVVIKANQLAGRNDRAEGIVHPDDVLQALEFIKPSTKDIEFMTFLALQEVTDLEFVPERFRQRAADKAALAEDIKAHTPKSHRSAREL
jgi:SpoVK/Ycf46/Vps4 family AAA+-type ATPase